MGKERVEWEVVGRDVNGAKTFNSVGDAADKAGDKVEDLGKKSDRTSEQVDGLGKSSKTTGEKVKDTTTEFQGLNAEIAKTQAEMRRLATEIDKTGNMDLFKDLRRQQSNLRRLTNIRKEMGEVGLDGAAGLVDGLASKLGPMLGKLPMGPWLAPAIVGAAPFIAATIGGAITTGVGVGVAGIGVKLASKDAEVQAAGKQLGAELSRGMIDASKPFVPETLRAIDTIRDEFQSLRPELRSLFADGAQYVEPLTEAVTGFARELVPGLRAATAEAGPLVDVLSEHGPRAAESMSNALTSLSDNSKQSAQAMDALFTSIEFGVESAATNIDLLSKTTTIYGDALLKWASGGEGGARKLVAVKPAAEQASAGVASVGNAAVRSQAEFDAFTASVNKFTGDAMSSERATLGLEEAMDRAAEAGRRNNDGISAGTEKGRANRELLLNLAGAANTAAAAILEQSGRQDLANAASNRGRDAFMRAAAAMGVSKAEAKRLADALFALPVAKNIAVTVDTRQAIAQAESLRQRISNMKARMGIVTYNAGTFGGPAHSGVGNSTGYSGGGRVLGPGTDTSDSVTRRVSRDEYVIRARAARAIGYDVLDDLNQADRRAPAARSAPAAAGGGRPAIGPDDLYRAMVRALQTAPVVRVDAGRTADLYTRTG